MTRSPDPCAPTATLALLLLVLGQGCAGELDPKIFPPPGGWAGTSGSTTGGMEGDAGMGAGGTNATTGCAEAPGIFTKYLCDSCHNAKGDFANFDMASTGWEKRLVGVRPKGGGALSPSVCMSAAKDYLVAGSVPATGLFLDKLKPKTATSCGEQMPTTADYLSTNELACVQRWANALTAP